MTAPSPSPARPAGGAAAAEALRGRLWKALQAGDEFAAAEMVLSAVEAGLDAESALLDVIAPVQARVGAEWAANRITVAQEHTASAINDRVIGAVAHHPAARRPPRRGRVTVACVDGEWHALPARLLAETLRLRGWTVDFLGAQVPAPHLIEHLHRTGPDAVALSSSIPTRLPTAHATITACQAAGVPVLAGGAAFGPDGRYARRLGADAWAADARAAADRLGEIAHRRPGATKGDGTPGPPPATGTGGRTGHRAAGDLPHLADQEYTLVTRSAHRLVATVVAGLEERFPAMARYTERQRRHTAEDIAHITEFLAVALYLDEPDPFTRFITWTADILTARDVPALSIGTALDLLADQLTDFPRATGLLRDGRRALCDHAPAASPRRDHSA